MVYGCGNQCVKLILFTANFLVFLFGGLIFGFSLWANLDANFAKHIGDLARGAKVDERIIDEIAQYQASLWVLTAVGALLFVVGFLGCCGAACESVVLLALFFVVMLALAVIEVFALVYLFTNRGELLGSLHNLLKESSRTEEGRRNLLPIEKALSCCGATIETASLYRDHCPAELREHPDCYTVLSDSMESAGQHILVVAVLLLAVQALSMCFSCVMCRAFRERGPIVYY